MKLNDVIKNKNKPVLVKFGAEWCAPCKAMSQVVKQLKGTDTGKMCEVLELDVDDFPQDVSALGIITVPTWLVFKDGDMVDKFIGAVHLNTLVETMKNHLK